MTDDPIGMILTSVAYGFVRSKTEPQPEAYRMAAIGGPLQVKWPDGRWFEVNVKEIEQPKEDK
jgi:hypothetical protein